MKDRDSLTKKFRVSDRLRYWMTDCIEDYQDTFTGEYLTKIKVVNDANKDTCILIKGLPVYFEILLNVRFDPLLTPPDMSRYDMICGELQNHMRSKTTIIRENRYNLKGELCYFVRVFFLNPYRRKKEIYRLRRLIAEKKVDFKLYEDDIPVSKTSSYALFIAPRTRIRICKESNCAFPLSGAFKLDRELSMDNIFKNIVSYRNIRFYDSSVINDEHYLTVMWDLETGEVKVFVIDCYASRD